MRKSRVSHDEGFTSSTIEDEGFTLPSNLTPREASWLLTHKGMVLTKHNKLTLIYKSLKAKGLIEEVLIGDLNMGEIGELLEKV